MWTNSEKEFQVKTSSAQEIYAQLYDGYVFDCPGELDFYQQLNAHPLLQNHGVLEIACGTGRITLQLAKEGNNITGLDLSSELLEVAKHKSTGLSNIQWIQGTCGTLSSEKIRVCHYARPLLSSLEHP